VRDCSGALFFGLFLPEKKAGTESPTLGARPNKNRKLRGGDCFVPRNDNMKTKIFKKENRGTADFGWLKANFSFSFGNYFNPERQQFGALRVLNDDCIAAGMGFGTHPHSDMEIVTIPLSGSLIHKDSMGNEGLISFGEVQVMSAGTGIYHSEFNASQTEELRLLQLWVFPEENGVKPRYDQKAFDLDAKKNTFVAVVCPSNKNEDGALWVYQQCYFNLGVFDSSQTVNYKVKIAGNGVFLFLIEGEIEVDNQKMYGRDAMEIVDFEQFNVIIKDKSKILLVEVPMAN
jgi:quercetin 2,3-dioxygenase